MLDLDWDTTAPITAELNGARYSVRRGEREESDRWVADIMLPDGGNDVDSFPTLFEAIGYCEDTAQAQADQAQK